MKHKLDIGSSKPNIESPKPNIESSKPNIEPPKPDIESSKPNIETLKPNIENEQISAYAEKDNHIAEKTIRNMKLLFERFGYETVFGRSDVMQVIGMGPTAASELLKRMREGDVIEAVTGMGKGKYRFLKRLPCV